MKTITTLLTATVALVGTSVILSAQAEDTRPGRAAIIERFDTDGDGQLNETERQAVREAMQARRGSGHRRPRIDWQQFDADGDGQLTGFEREEAATHLRAVVSTSPRAMKRLDTDGDGQLSDLEWDVAREKFEQRMADRQANGGKRARGKKCDGNCG